MDKADYYINKPTRYRIFAYDGDWHLDAVDDEGNYTERVWVFPSWDQAIDSLPEFATLVPLVVKDNVRGCHRCFTTKEAIAHYSTWLTLQGEPVFMSSAWWGMVNARRARDTLRQGLLEHRRIHFE